MWCLYHTAASQHCLHSLHAQERGYKSQGKSYSHIVEWSSIIATWALCMMNTSLLLYYNLSTHIAIVIYPLSEVKKTKVSLSALTLLSASNISPTPQSSSFMASPYPPLMLVPVKCCPANWGSCVCWNAMYKKKGMDCPKANEQCMPFW